MNVLCGFRLRVSRALLTGVLTVLTVACLAACGDEPPIQARQDFAATPVTAPTSTLSPTPTVSAMNTSTTTVVEPSSPTPIAVTSNEAMLEGLTWVLDGLTPSEERELKRLKIIDEGHPDVIQALLAYPWIEDELSEGDREFIQSLGSMVKFAPEAAIAVVTIPDLTGHLTGAALKSLRYVSQFQRPTWNRLKERPWFQDGLTKEEAALIVVLEGDSFDVNVLHKLVQSGRVLSETITTPLAGEVTVFVVSQAAPRQEMEDGLKLLVSGVLLMEEVMNSPWKNPNVIAHVVYGVRAIHFESHVLLGGYPFNYLHELGHYYFIDMPGWLTEGGANFLDYYVADSIYTGADYDLETRYLENRSESAYCAEHGASNINEWNENLFATRSTEGPLDICRYALGSSFLLGMYLQLGHDATSLAFRALYNLTVSQFYMTEGEIYRVFLSSVPIEQRDEFRRLYSCLHGGPFSDWDEDDTVAKARDREALAALYDATNGSGWVGQDNWASEIPIWQWHGVTTDCRGHVLRLELPDSNLSGPMPPDLGELSKLEFLDLSGNQLTGTIPEDLGHSNLVWLDLSGNELTGSIPSVLGDLRNLMRLFLSENHLSGPVPAELGGLSNLEELYLSRNQLTGSIPPALGDLSDLRSLDLSGNELTGSIPPVLGDLRNLTMLYLSENHLSGPVPAELGDLSNLEELYLSRNQLTGSIPPALGDLSDLRSLDLSGNELTGSIPPVLGDLSDLRRLYVSDNQFSGAVPTELANLSNLDSLDLSGNQFTGAIPTELANLSSLYSLDLSGNQLTGPIPTELGSFKDMEWLSLSGNQLTGTIPAKLGSLQKLGRLYLSGNHFTGPIPAELGGLSDLSTLDLSRNQLTGSIPVELGSLSKLERLNLSGNQLTGAIPSELGRLSNLTRLGLYRNQLTGSIPAELGGLSDLSTLDLSRNQLSGPIPVELGGLSKLERLYLSANQLSGMVPGELGRLSSLTRLVLFRNQLSGAIPVELGKLSSLSTLDLSRNQLTGQVPEELVDLTSLEVLYLGGNQLTGCTPRQLLDVETNDLESTNLPPCS